MNRTSAACLASTPAQSAGQPTEPPTLAQRINDSPSWAKLTTERAPALLEELEAAIAELLVPAGVEAAAAMLTRLVAVVQAPSPAAFPAWVVEIATYPRDV